MRDVRVHYLEVNFPEIAEQLAHVRGGEPSGEERAAAAERLRELIRRLRRGTVESGPVPHEPRASAAELIAGVNGELSPEERAVLDHFFELFARSMARTQQAARPEPEVAEQPAAQPAAAEVSPAPEEPPAPQPQAAEEPVAAAPSTPEPPAEPAAAAPSAPEPPAEPAATVPSPPEPPVEAAPPAPEPPPGEPIASEAPPSAAPAPAELP